MATVERAPKTLRMGARERRDPSPELEHEFETIYRREYPVALRYARRHVDDDTAEDAVQTVFVRFWEGYVATPPLAFRIDKPDVIRAAVLRSVRNELITRRSAAETFDSHAPQIREHINRTRRGRTPVDLGYSGKELAALLEEKLAKLPPRQREVFTLVKFDGLSYEVTAAILGVSVDTVHQHLVKANAFLRRELAPYKIAEPKWWFPIDETLNDEAHDNG